MAKLFTLNLIIVRHGNTFDKGDVVRRVGLKTDLPLSSSGLQQASQLGTHLAKQFTKLDQIFCSDLIRTEQTANLILDNYQQQPSLQPLSLLNEIDYGIDDGKPENEVIKRIGQDALMRWEEDMKVPQGWLFDAKQRFAEIKKWLASIQPLTHDKTIMLVTSNGIARLFSLLIDDHEQFKQTHSLKMPTASFSHLQQDNKQQWRCLTWGNRP